MSTIPARIIHPYADSTWWTNNNPVLREGELGFEENTHMCKIGDGTTPWNQLKYQEGNGQKYLVQSLAYAKRENVGEMLRGYLAYIYTGSTRITDRAFLYLTKIVDGEKTCDLVPVSFFSEESIREQAEIEQ